MTKAKKNQFNKIKKVKLIEKKNLYSWSKKNEDKLYKMVKKRMRIPVKNDQEIRADVLVEAMYTRHLPKLILLEGDGRMLSQIIKKFVDRGLEIPEIIVIELDKKRHEYHKTQFPIDVKKEKGNIFDTIIDKNTFVYYNFCSIGSEVKQGGFLDKLYRTPHFMLGFTTRGIKIDEFNTEKKNRPETELAKTVSILNKNLKPVSERGVYRT